MHAMILTFVIPAVALIFTVAFFGLWWNNRKCIHVLAFSACFASIAIGVAFNIWISANVGLPGIVFYHLLSMAGLLAMMWGLTVRHGQKAPIGAYGATALFTCAILWIASAAGEVSAMKMAQNTNSALIMAMMATNLWHYSKDHWADRALIWVLSTLALFGFVRPLLTELSDVLFGGGEAGAATLTSIHALVLAVLLTLMALCLAAMVISDNMDQQRHEAAFDPLSGVRMRGAFESDAKALLQYAREEGLPVSLIVADIDHFKAVNDAFGHVAGDRVIAGFGKMLGQMTRGRDITGRVGGEEFCILVWNCNLTQAAKMSERIRRAFAASSHCKENHDVRCTASFGIAEAERDEGYSALFERADAALYRAKRAGRNRVAADGELETDTSETVVDFAPRASLVQRG
ncbi:GGDEF domain-containing protein [Erythrobacter sp. W53]|uniref:GGDEF domain-containing protein n=1 Tax=Erythrobacter sp. W53 TaxID=3425947 RepID=UPI003D766A80